MSVSVVIPVHDRIDHLEKSLLSLDLWQSYEDFDVIISDDNSREDFPALIERLKDKVKFNIKYTGYKYDDKPHLFRLAKARNEGCRLSDKDFLLIIDGDRLLAKNYIFDCVTKYEHMRHSGFCPGELVLGGRTVYLKVGPDKVNVEENPGNYNQTHLIESQDRCLCMFDPNGDRDITDRDWANLYGGGIFMKRCYFEEIGGYNEEYEGYGHEDNDFALSIRRGGARIFLCYNLLMYHMHHDVYHTDYNINEFYKAYEKQPYDFTKENFRRYRARLTPQEVAASRF